MIKSLPYSQLLRARRIVSQENEVEETLTTMATGFQHRGYPQFLVDEHKNKVLNSNRMSLLQQSKKAKMLARIPFVSTYNDLSPKIARVISKHWALVRDSYPQIKEFKQPPLMSYRRSKNLKDVLVRSAIQPTRVMTKSYIRPPKLGSYPCLGCINCKIMLKGDSFTHPSTGKSLNINISSHATATGSFIY